MRSVLSFFGLMVLAFAVLGASGNSAVADERARTTAEYSRADDGLFTLASHPARACCKRGRHDWWATRRACWRAGGYVVAARHCRNDWNEARICCKRGRYDWWATPRACARAGGYRVSGWQCRNG
jgi:hypothetical protein